MRGPSSRSLGEPTIALAVEKIAEIASRGRPPHRRRSERASQIIAAFRLADDDSLDQLRRARPMSVGTVGRHALTDGAAEQPRADFFDDRGREAV